MSKFWSVPFLLGVFAGVFFIFPAQAEVVINEVMSSNGTNLRDEDGDHPDWIELYNTSDEPYNLKGHYLTDDPQELEWEFPEQVMEPGEHLVIFASNKDRKEGELHTNFAVSKAGETLFLVDPGFSIMDQMESVHIPRDKTYGRKPDGSDNWVYFKNPTPGRPNKTEGYSKKLSEPNFSKQGGFHKRAFELTLDSDYENAEVRYTLDGSEPDRSSPRYDEPLEISALENKENIISEIPTAYEGLNVTPEEKINKANVVRARVFKEGALPSDVQTQTYWVEEEGPERYSFPVVSLSVNNKHLFDHDTGIYVPGRRLEENWDPDESIGGLHANYRERGRDWERPVHFELYDRQGRQALSQLGGLRIHGSFSRAYPRKSLRLYARRDYGKFYYNYPLFEDKPHLTRSKRFMLRNSGQDWNETMFKDAFIQSLFDNLNVLKQGQTPAIVFINGEYWGIHNIRERIDQHFLAENRDAHPEEVDLLENRHVVKEGSDDHYVELLNHVEESDIKTEASYEKVHDYMKVDNYIDYNIAHMYSHNTDWPGRNVNYWRPQEEGGKWEWIVFDTDFGFDLIHPTESSQEDMIDHATTAEGDGYPNPPWSTFLLRNLLKNEAFRHHFINRYADLLNSEFRPQRVINRLESYREQYLPELEEHIGRWTEPEDQQEWESKIKLMKDFALKRPAHVRSNIVGNFDKSGTYELELSSNNPHLGYIKLNTIDVHDLDNWQGVYFKGVPVSLKAKPYDGVKFEGWEGDINGNDKKLTIDPNDHTRLKAIFSPKKDYEPPYINPAPHTLSEDAFTFDDLDPQSPAGDFPDNMALHQTSIASPAIDAPITADWDLAFDKDQHSRIVGLNEKGVGFINTPELQPMAGAGFAGAAVVALDTRNRENIQLSWKGATLAAHDNQYALRLQYRTGKYGAFQDFKNKGKRPVEYIRNPLGEDQKHFKNIRLPDHLEDEPYVQLRWKYHFISGDEDDKGPKLALNNIEVTSDPQRDRSGDEKITLYPNPGNGFFQIDAKDLETPLERISVRSIDGREVLNGTLNDLKRDGFVNLSDLGHGSYFLLLFDEEGTVYRERLIIENVY